MRRMMVLTMGASMLIASGLFPSQDTVRPVATHSTATPAVQFRGDFNTGDTSQWELETVKKYSLQVKDGGPGHPTAGRFEVRDGDHPVDSGERSEAKVPNEIDVSNGDERWYVFSMMFDKNFPKPKDGWCDPLQWHPAKANHKTADGSPMMNFQCGNKGDDNLYLEVGDKERFNLGPLDRGKWHKFWLHVKFSTDPKKAFEEVYRDGELVIPKMSPKHPNMSSPKAYLKIGIYRKQINDGPMVVWHDDMTIYTSAPPKPTKTGTTPPPPVNTCSSTN